MLKNYLLQMQTFGVRRLLLLSGTQSWCYQQLSFITAQQAGDWLCLSNNSDHFPLAIPFSRAPTLLGQEFTHAIFDATQGVNLEAFAILGGTLTAGSLYVLMIPQWQGWAEHKDLDSLRWSEYSHPITTPNFVHFIQQQLLNDPLLLWWMEGGSLQGDMLETRPVWHGMSQQSQVEQANVLKCLLHARPGIYVLTAPRGRGKSTIAGKLAADWQGTCLLTAPTTLSAEIVQRWSNNRVIFYAPDKLLTYCKQSVIPRVDWLIIDEAAAIPLPLIQQLMPYFSRILLITTVHGYEGTGRGFLLKLCEDLPDHVLMSLHHPVRWAANDPLESIISKLLLLDADSHYQIPHATDLSLCQLSQRQMQLEPSLLRQFYGLLTLAHYRTSPLDLRRILDAPGMKFFVLLDQYHRIAAALWGIEEGGLTPALADAVWAGIRRPRGNLLVQSLAAHAGVSLAATLYSIRISRIAVTPTFRRQGFASRLIKYLYEYNQHVDFLSVSFGYTDELWSFWQACGFQLVHIGSQKEASSDCYSAMAIYPLSLKAQLVVKDCQRRLQRNWLWLQQRILVNLPIIIDADQSLDGDDWQELAGFVFASRPITSAYGSLCRLLLTSKDSEQAVGLTYYLFDRLNINVVVKRLKLSGKKALVKRWRQEAEQLMLQLDPSTFYYWQSIVSKLRFDLSY